MSLLARVTLKVVGCMDGICGEKLFRVGPICLPRFYYAQVFLILPVVFGCTKGKSYKNWLHHVFPKDMSFRYVSCLPHNISEPKNLVKSLVFRLIPYVNLNFGHKF